MSLKCASCPVSEWCVFEPEENGATQELERECAPFFRPLTLKIQNECSEVFSNQGSLTQFISKYTESLISI